MNWAQKIKPKSGARGPYFPIFVTKERLILSSLSKILLKEKSIFRDGLPLAVTVGLSET